MSKQRLIRAIITSFQKGQVEDLICPSGTLYKNIDGVIYRIDSTKCPFCETEPIGIMTFRYDNVQKSHFLECNENRNHVLPFDFKKDI